MKRFFVCTRKLLRQRILVPLCSVRGFSLMEVMIVIGLIAVISAIAIPVLNAFMPGYRLQGAVRGIVSDMQQAKTRAIRSNNNAILAINPPGVCMGWPGCAAPAGPCYRIFIDTNNDQVCNNGDTVITNTQLDATITFPANGNAANDFLAGDGFRTSGLAFWPGGVPAVIPPVKTLNIGSTSIPTVYRITMTSAGSVRMERL
ncbi:MAG: GspH/FimT family pseudopilin [Desulforhopalus sp.]|nr:GspH/FimT family pseudopilin [Desulforhopalus sp.]